MINELEKTENEGGLVGMSQSELVQIAAQAEQRIDAIKKIKNTAIKLTNENDWVDQGGKPYLQASGSEKVAGAFSISWSFLTAEPDCEEDPDGHYTYTYHGRFTMAGRSIEIDGSRSSKDPFFKEYHYPNGRDKPRVEREIHERTNKRDVKMAALTNLLGNGITRMLGIRNMTYADLEEFAGIKKENLGKVTYGKDKPEVKKTQSKSQSKDDKATIKIKEVRTQSGEKKGKPWTKYSILSVDDVTYNTFSDTIGQDAETLQGTDVEVVVSFKTDKFGNTINDDGFQIQAGPDSEGREPGEDG